MRTRENQNLLDFDVYMLEYLCEAGVQMTFQRLQAGDRQPALNGCDGMANLSHGSSQSSHVVTRSEIGE
jgi:hypothetical protein